MLIGCCHGDNQSACFPLKDPSCAIRCQNANILFLFHIASVVLWFALIVIRSIVMIEANLTQSTETDEDVFPQIYLVSCIVIGVAILVFLLICQFRLYLKRRDHITYLQVNNENKIRDDEDIVLLDVGGTKFKTTESTLMQCNYFDAMFDHYWEVDHEEHNCIFIDRDGKLFAYILAFLRGNTTLPGDTNLLKMLKKEAEFYGIESLINYITLKLGENDNIIVRIDTINFTQRIIKRKTLLNAIEHGFHELFANGRQPNDINFRLVTSIDIAPFAAEMWVMLLDAFLFGKAGLVFIDTTTAYFLAHTIALGKRWGVPSSTLQCIADHISDMKLRDSKIEANH